MGTKAGVTDHSHLHEVSAFGREYVYDAHRFQAFRLGPNALHAWRSSHRHCEAGLDGEANPSVLRRLEANQLIRRYAARPHAARLPNRGYINDFVLHITQGCNMRCHYCYSNQGCYETPRTARMPLTTAKGAVDFLYERSDPRRDPVLTFFGGEPLMNLRVIRDTVAYAESRGHALGRRMRFSMTTNGTLLKPEIVTFLKQHRFDLLVSIDGIGADQDVHRVMAGGKGSFRILEPKLKDLLRVRPTVARATLARGNVDAEKVVTDIIDFGFSGVYLSVATGNDAEAVSAAAMRQLCASLERLATRYLEMAKRGDYLPFLTLQEAVEQIHKGRVILSGCSGGKRLVAVLNNGDIQACTMCPSDETPFRMGNVLTGEFDARSQSYFAGRCVDDIETCSKCWARYLCGGGCFARNVRFDGDIDTPDPVSCAFHTKVYELAVVIVYELGQIGIAPLPEGLRAPLEQRQHASSGSAEGAVTHTGGAPDGRAQGNALSLPVHCASGFPNRNFRD